MRLPLPRAPTLTALLSAPRKSASVLQVAQRYPLSTLRGEGDRHSTNVKKAGQKAFDERGQHARLRQNQVKRPWLREGVDTSPAEEAGDDANSATQGKNVKVSWPAALPMYVLEGIFRNVPLVVIPLLVPVLVPALTDRRVSGRLLTTPTRLLKLVLPLPLRVEKDLENNDDPGHDFGRSVSPNDRIQPLALLIHPRQPLSYVERLIQAELPPVVENGKEKIPSVYFRAEDTGDDNDGHRDPGNHKKGGGHVERYSGLGREGPEREHSEKSWVRWSSSTEVGDFIRDAARGREFAIEVEGHGLLFTVAVPSFNDRTYYTRLRLRKTAREVDALAAIKKECDALARRGAHRLAKGGFVLLTGWWGVVFWITFMTDYGWDLIEPVTYLVGLTTIMAGYLWFLFISRDLSYEGAMRLTVSRRRQALYDVKGFDPNRWERLIEEANELRREIRTVATEYDVEWDEAKDVGEHVKEIMTEERNKNKAASDEDAKDEVDVGDVDKGKNQDEKKEGM